MATEVPRILKNPVRALMQTVGLKRGDPASAPAENILDSYCSRPPSPQNALDIFRGEWSSKLPQEYNSLTAGELPLFEDTRIAWGLNELGGIQGQKVLELGPLEAGHSYMLERFGAASVVSIEANTRAYLKCLVVKEALALERTRFLCGDFMEYLRCDPPAFDMVLASGVLYHMCRPAELIHRISEVTDRVLIWTHYYDRDIIESTPHLAPKFPRSEAAECRGFRHTLHRQEYLEATKWRGFCGGSAAHSAWMSRQDLLDCLAHFGFRDVKITMEEPRFVNGPCLLLAARK